MIIQPPSHLERVKGIFVGGCVKKGEGKGFIYRTVAHAHNSTKDQHYGWICFRGYKRIKDICVQNDDGTTSLVGTNRILMHEYAHILTPNHSHDDEWRSMMKQLGQPIPKRYKNMYKKRKEMKK